MASPQTSAPAVAESAFLGDWRIGGDRPFFVIAGPCVIESSELVEEVCRSMQAICGRLGLHYVFKSSFDKANRSSSASRRGPGLQEGLRILADVRERLGVPVLTDIHDVSQVEAVAEVVDILQVPAFLSRQTDLIEACARSGRWTNVKKGQFMAPGDCRHILEKMRAAGSDRLLVTERGASFGYHNLVFDPRSPEIMHEHGLRVVFDCTHSVQLPGAGVESGGERRFIPVLARAAVAAGVEGLFLEVHPEPARAWSDAATQFPLEQTERLLAGLLAIDRTVKAERSP